MYQIAPTINVPEIMHELIQQNRMIIQSEFADIHKLSIEETHEYMKQYYRANIQYVSAAFLTLLKSEDHIQSKLIKDVDLDQIDKNQIIDLSIQAIFPKGLIILEETFPIVESQSKILKTHITHVNISNVLVAMNNQFLTSQGQKKETKPAPKKMEVIQEKRIPLNNYSEIQLPMKQLSNDISNSLEVENNSKSQNISRPKIKLKSKEQPIQQPIQQMEIQNVQQSQESIKPPEQAQPQQQSQKQQSPPKESKPAPKKGNNNLLGFFKKK